MILKNLLKLAMKNFNKFLLLGHKGYLGSYLMNNLDCNILKDYNLYNDGKKYKYIINCIAKPDIKFCEMHPDISKYSNYEVIKEIKKLYSESILINFSSYYVYDDENLCTEESKTSDSLTYSRHKLLGEKLNSDGFNFRLGKIFGKSKKLQNRLTEKIINSDEIYLDDINFNPVSLKCIFNILKNIDCIEDKRGIYNLSNDGIVSHYDYGKYILNYINSKCILYKDNNRIKQFNNHGKFCMSIEKLKKYFNIDHWSVDMNDYLKTL